MEHQSILREKLSQHEFEYRGGAWENMEALLDSAVPLAAAKPVSVVSKWLKLLGAAAIVGAVTFWGVSQSNEQKTAQPAVNQPPTTLETPTISEPEKATSVKQSVAKPMLSVSPKAVSEPTVSPSPVVVPQEHNTTTAKQHNSKTEHPTPVDDSKVYRDNKNYKKPNLIHDEHSKPPAASDLHENN